MVVRALERKLKLSVATPSAKPVQNLDVTIDFCAMSPLQVENSLHKIHFIKNLIIGGAQVSQSLKNKISQSLKDKNTRNYGLRNLRHERNAFPHCFKADLPSC